MIYLAYISCGNTANTFGTWNNVNNKSYRLISQYTSIIGDNKLGLLCRCS